MTEPDQQSTLSLVGVFLHEGKLILVDANREQFECTNPQELWDDLQRICRDPSIPKAELSSGQVAGEEEIIADSCNRLGNAVGERYGSLAGALTTEGSRRLGPVFLNGLRKLSKRDRFRKR